MINSTKQRNLNERTASRYLVIFVNGDWSLEDWVSGGDASTIHDNWLGAITETDTLKHLQQIGKYRKWVHSGLNKNKKQIRLAISALIFFLCVCTRNSSIVDRVATRNKNEFRTTSDGILKTLWSKLKHTHTKKHLCQTKTAPKEILFGYIWGSWNIYNFLNQDENFSAVTYCQKIDKMHPEVKHLSRKFT